MHEVSVNNLPVVQVACTPKYNMVRCKHFSVCPCHAVPDSTGQLYAVSMVHSEYKG